MLRPLYEVQETNDVSELIGHMLGSVGLVHAEHLTTRSYARHKALDKYYKEMPEVIDEFAEAYIANNAISLTSNWITDEFMTAEDIIEHLLAKSLEVHPTLPPSLTNPLEDVMTLMEQVKFLLRLS